jgi:hypothetical protein
MLCLSLGLELLQHRQLGLGNPELFLEIVQLLVAGLKCRLLFRLLVTTVLNLNR